MLVGLLIAAIECIELLFNDGLFVVIPPQGGIHAKQLAWN